MKKIHIVTPLRDEIDNIDVLVKSISNSVCKIETWVIVENNSTDGSKEYLRELKVVKNVNDLIILNRDDFSSHYQLGGKYSAIVNEGFKFIINKKKIDNEDFIGIVDADSFPIATYFLALIEGFEKDDTLGITSGRARTVDGGRESVHSKSWVMGSCRLWRYKCFLEAGYIIGPSADTVSVALAEIKGWKVYPINTTHFYARDVGWRVDFSYYGKCAYYRGNTVLYALIRVIKYALIGRLNNSYGFAKGYFLDYLKNDPRVPNSDVRKYFSNYLWNVIHKKFLK